MSISEQKERLRRRRYKRSSVMLAVLFYIAGVVFVSAIRFMYSQQQVMTTIDSNLKRAAEGMAQILPEGYSDRARTATAVAADEYLQVNRALYRFSRTAGVDYLYTGAIISNQFYITGYSLPPEEEGVVDNPPYFMLYDQAGEAFVTSLGDTNIFYETYEDQWGKRRGATLVVMSAGGQQCLVGADFKLSYVNRALYRDALLALAQGLLYLLLAVPLVLSFNGVYRRLAHGLHRANRRLRYDMKKRKEAEVALRQAYDDLQQLDRLKNDVVHLFTHEMKTPLNGIKGFSELMLNDDALDNQQREYIAMIHTAGLRLLEFTDKAIMIAKFKAGGSINPSLGCVGDHLVGVIDLSMAGGEPAQVLLNGDERLNWHLDWDLVTRAVAMVVDNARKHSRLGGTVGVSYAAVDDMLRIEVVDSGSGIDPGSIGRIFDEFGVDDVEHHAEGQHLSLALCRYICQAHGGDVSIESSPYEGTRVCMTFLDVRQEGSDVPMIKKG